MSRLSLAETAKLTASGGIGGVFPARVRSRRESTAIAVRKGGLAQVGIDECPRNPERHGGIARS
jgi:hypothetical protein